jgi:hypothetical protein
LVPEVGDLLLQPDNLAFEGGDPAGGGCTGAANPARSPEMTTE